MPHTGTILDPDPPGSGQAGHSSIGILSYEEPNGEVVKVIYYNSWRLSFKEGEQVNFDLLKWRGKNIDMKVAANVTPV